MKSRQRKQHMHEQRVKRKAAKAAQKRNNARGYEVSKTSTKSRVPTQTRAQLPFYENSSPFLQLFKTWQPPQSDRKVIPFPVFQSNRRARAEVESVA
jgi:hypothetical protein